MVSDILCGPHVLAVHCSDIERLGLLGFVRMLGTAINAQIAHLNATKRPARNHALDGFLNDTLRKTTLEDRLRGAFLDAADKSGVIVIDLVLALATGQHDMGGIDDDDMVATI